MKETLDFFVVSSFFLVVSRLFLLQLAFCAVFQIQPPWCKKVTKIHRKTSHTVAQLAPHLLRCPLCWIKCYPPPSARPTAMPFPDPGATTFLEWCFHGPLISSTTMSETLPSAAEQPPRGGGICMPHSPPFVFQHPNNPSWPLPRTSHVGTPQLPREGYERLGAQP